MTNVILHPVASGGSLEHYLNTIDPPIPQEKIRPFLNAEEQASLDRHAAEEGVRVWGTLSKNLWDKIQTGDICLFYRNSERDQYAASTTVSFKIRNSRLARELWGVQESGETWEYVYFLSDFLPQEIDRRALNEVAGYAPNFKLRGVIIPREEGASERIIQRFGLKTDDALPNTSFEPETVPHTVSEEMYLSQAHEDFAQALRDCHLFFGPDHENVTRRFLASLATKPLCILTGLSGSGKTQIAMRFGEWLGDGRWRLIPVRPDWTGAEYLFGYEDALKPTRDSARAWNVPEALEFMLAAVRNPQDPYLLILDEMNLAHVERYFADVLSGMESRSPCLPNLERGADGFWRITSSQEKVAFPRNLFVVGTVNVDETTYMFSPKVLDRANTFEFRVKTDELSVSYRRPTACRQGALENVRRFLEVARNDSWHLEHEHPSLERFEGHLRDLHRVLAVDGFEFGHRVLFEAVRFSALIRATGEPDPLVALDSQVMQKVLPRLNGSRRSLEPTLCAVGRFCYDLTPDLPENEGDRRVRAEFDPLATQEAAPRLPLSYDKVRRMTRSLRANQFVSFTD